MRAGLLLLLAAVASAQGEPRAADEVLAAFRANDDAALAKLAQRAKPDPWRVADELCYRGEHDAAAAFAGAAKTKALEKLPAYVETRREKTDDEGVSLD